MVDTSQFTGVLLEQAHKAVGVPAAFTMYVAIVLILLVAGIFIAGRSGKFWAIFFIVLIGGAIVLVGVVNMPNAVQAIAGIVQRIIES